MIKQNAYLHLFGGHVLPIELNDLAEREKLNDYLADQMSYVKYDSKIRLFTPNGVPDRMFFVIKGIVTGFTFDIRKQKNKVVFLWLDGAMVADAKHFIAQTESHLSIEAYPDTVVASLSFKQIEDLFEHFPYTQVLFKILKEDNLLYSNKDLIAQEFGALEKVEEMNRIYPAELLEAVPKTLIADWLRMSIQHYNRLLKSR
ncbi:Crp/Fnr family transcriptional regulator [Pedobacter metabolipauper]|uniref:CRP-like cAMP-binding protein n=1 Tax=Pedobacter metabolipauper TaxID=425513 RepID=A0A4R6SWE9_9SPHI|nr:hypothetical protein [Pedobacter metabolipauper]TDQ10278.1 CRP-like cAMP-binding protein [Pedobacter metabolipauper]